MGEFADLSKDIIPVFHKIEEIKARYGITSLSLDSFHTIDQLYGSKGGKEHFRGGRGRDRGGNLEIPIIQKEKPGGRNLRASHIGYSSQDKYSIYGRKKTTGECPF